MNPSTETGLSQVTTPRPRHDESGMTTAEYAVGTVSACSFAALLFKIITSGFGQGLLESIFHKVLGTLPF
jgi:Protein of unknown function (DUF4244)